MQTVYNSDQALRPPNLISVTGKACDIDCLLGYLIIYCPGQADFEFDLCLIWALMPFNFCHAVFDLFLLWALVPFFVMLCLIFVFSGLKCHFIFVMLCLIFAFSVH